MLAFISPTFSIQNGTLGSKVSKSGFAGAGGVGGVGVSCLLVVI